ncbi:uncharacterized protein DS421_3g81540 [Arachis hypogaea]|nr:uncharacterized protein DS421_3g81540 [Arachis hypogaea]
MFNEIQNKSLIESSVKTKVKLTNTEKDKASTHTLMPVSKPETFKGKFNLNLYIQLNSIQFTQCSKRLKQYRISNTMKSNRAKTMTFIPVTRTKPEQRQLPIALAVEASTAR